MCQGELCSGYKAHTELALYASQNGTKSSINDMTQDERWKVNWQEVMDFMEANKRRPSKYVPEEKLMHHWWRHQQKLFNAGLLKEDRIGMFKQLIETGERYRHVNQYT